VSATEAADEGGSGTVRYYVDYGPDKDSPDRQKVSELAPLIIDVPEESADYWFSARAEDRAGNVSEPGAPTEQRAITVDRIAGEDRIATALALSRRSFASSKAVVVASASSFADGLCAGSLAGALKAPVLLVGSGALRSDVASELARLGAEDAAKLNKILCEGLI
jgi:hypothetical protein